MGDPVTINLRHVARGLGIPPLQVQAVVELLDDGNTVPFITRYRKDQTGGLDDEQIRQIQSRLVKMRLLSERKQTILRSIESQGKLTEKLAKQIHLSGTTKRLEDLYLPYKPKKQTLATVARSRGLEELSQEILDAADGCLDLDTRAADFANPDRGVPTAADALLGAGHILAERFSERADLRQNLRDLLQRTGKIVSTRIGGNPKPVEKKSPPSEKRAENSPTSGEASATEADTPVVQETSEVPPVEVDTPVVQETSEVPPVEADTPVVQETSEVPPVEADTPVVQETSEVSPVDSDTPVVQETSEVSPVDSDTPVVQETSESAPVEETVQNADGVVPPSTESAERPTEQIRSTEQTVVVEPVLSKTTSTTPPKPTKSTPPRPAKAVRKLSKKELRKKKAEEKKQKAFSDYFDYSEEIKKIPSHRILAINRGDRAKVLRVRIEVETEAMVQSIDEACVPADHPHVEFLRGCAQDALTRLILPALEREVRRELTDRAELHAVGVFAKNLRNLLLQPPVRDRRVLAIDPGFRSGCKLAALDQFGNLLAHDVIYLVGKPDRRGEARQTILALIERFQLTVVAIGNGAACRDTETFIAEMLEAGLKEKACYVVVNEAGASVYSTSRIGREEFPNYDALLRGAISIGRRLQDPLSELVKINPANIGVGLYQHDVKAKHLRTSLDDVVESCVNYVGVDVNTASPALLRYASGLNQLTARRVYEHRLANGPFRNREQLRQVAGFGEATFVQSAGFLKIVSGDNPFDATWIHPESYDIATRVTAKLNCSISDLAEHRSSGNLSKAIAELDQPKLAEELEIGTLLLKDILSQLARPGRDPREDLPAPIFKEGVLKIEDLSPGLKLAGTVLNVVDFGAFVDIGMHDSGLVHVSQLADKFVRDPHEVVSVGDVVHVWVIEVDKQRRRVSLTMIEPGTERSGRHRKGQPSHEKPEKIKQGTQTGSGARRSDRGGPRRKSSRRPAKRPARTDYKPKSPPKPVTPLSEEMKTGKKPMRSFSDLAQFFTKPDSQPNDRRKKKPRRSKHSTETEPPKPQPPSDETPQPPSDETPQPPIVDTPQLIDTNLDDTNLDDTKEPEQTTPEGPTEIVSNDQSPVDETPDVGESVETEIPPEQAS